MKKTIYKASSFPKKKQPSVRQMFRKSLMTSLTLITLVSTIQFDTSAERNGNENPLNFAENVQMNVTKVIDAYGTKILPTASAATVTTSVKDTSVTGLENARKVDFVKDFGADPTGKTDSSKAWNEMLKASGDEILDVYIPKGQYMLDPKTVNLENYPTKSKGLRITGAGIDDTHFLYKNPKINSPEFYFSKIFMENGASLEISGFTVDGSEGPQNQYFTMGSPAGFQQTEMYKGFQIFGTGQLSVHDMKFQHMYGGYAIMAEEYKDVRIKNVILDDVGGDDVTDSFGMGIYLGGHTGDAVVNVDNYEFFGKVGDGPQYNPGTGNRNNGDPSNTAWIGIVYENGTIQGSDESKWLKDQNTTFNITNSKIMDVETTFHVESAYGNVYWNVDNLETRAKDYFIVAGVNGEMKERSNNIKANLLPYGRNNIVKGLYYTEKEYADNKSGRNTFNMYNATVNYLDLDGTPAGAPGKKDMYMGTSYGDGVTATYTCSTFNSLPWHLVENGGGIFKDSAINLWENSPFASSADPKKDMMRGGGDETQMTFVKYEGETSVNKAGEWKTAATCKAPDWLTPNGTKVPDLEEAVDPAEIGTNPSDNVAPVLTINDLEIVEGSEFNPLEGVTVSDDKDKDLEIEVEGEVDVNTPGEYIQKFTVKDSAGAVTTGERRIVVKAKAEEPTTETPTKETPTTEMPTTETPTTEAPTTETSTTETLTTETPTTETPTTETPTTETPTTETPTTEMPTPDVPEKENQLPQIFAFDQYVMEGTKFDPKKNVFAMDHEDGNLTDEVKVLKNTVDTTQPGVGEVTYELTDPKTKLKTTTTIKVTVGKDWTKEIKSLQGITETLNGQLNDLNSKYDELNDKVEVNAEEIKAIKGQINDAKQIISELQEKITEVTKNYDNLKKDSDALKEQVQKIVEQITDLTRNVNELNEKYEAIKADLDKSKEDVERLKETVKQLDDAVKSLNETVRKMTDKINVITERLDMMASKIDNQPLEIIINNNNTNSNTNNNSRKANKETAKESDKVSETDEKKNDSKENESSDDAVKEKDDNGSTAEKSSSEEIKKPHATVDEPSEKEETSTVEESTAEEQGKEESKENSVEEQKNDKEIVTTENNSDIRKPEKAKDSILPSTGQKALDSVLYTGLGVTLLIAGIAGYIFYRRKSENNM